MADLKVAYATASSITWSSGGPDSLATVTMTSPSNVIDNNSSTNYLDALVEVVLENSNASPGGNNQCLMYVIGSVDGTNFGSSDDTENLRYLGRIIMNDADAQRSQAMSVAQAFGGIMPREWKLLIYNDTGQSLESTGNTAQYTGVYMTG